MNQKFANFAAGNLQIAITNISTTITLVAGDSVLFPTLGVNEYFYCVLKDVAGILPPEIVKVTATAGSVYTIVRGQDNTVAANWAAGTEVLLRWVNASILDLATQWAADIAAAIVSVAASIYATLAASGGSALIGFIQSGTGAALRTLQSKNRDSVSFADFGAVGNGTADDTVALQAALNTGKNIIPDSTRRTYKITGPLLVVNDSQDIDFGYSTVNLDDATGSMVHLTIGDDVTKCNAVKVRRGIFTRVQAATDGCAIFGRYVGLLLIDECRIYNATGAERTWDGIRLWRAIICKISNNYIQGVRNYGIYLLGTGPGADRCVDIEIINNRIENTLNIGLVTYDFVEGIYCNENIFYNNKSSCVYCTASANANGLTSFKFKNNDFDSCNTVVTAAFYMQYIDDVLIEDNWFSNNAGSNLLIDTSTIGYLISGNFMISGAYDNLTFAGSAAVIGDNLMAHAGGGKGIYLAATAAQINIDGNYINGASYGIDTFSAPVDVQIGTNFISSAVADVRPGALSSTSASATALRLLGTWTIYNVSGVTNISTISDGWAGREVTLIFAGILTITNATGAIGSVSLQGAVNFTTAANNTLTIAHNGVQWYEVARKT